jgi:SagB-type dehydrogenase family enzyme
MTRALPIIAIGVLTGLSSCAHRDLTRVEPIPLNQLSNDQLRVFLKGYEGDWRKDTDQSQSKAPPAPEKSYPDEAERIDLVNPGTFKAGRMPLVEAIEKRRSRRDYAETPIDKQALSFLLWSTQGISKFVKDGNNDAALSLRTVPSAGGRYPIETYLAINNVEGISPGIYRYLVSRHQLLPVRVNDTIRDELQTACYNRKFVGRAGVVFIWAAVPARTEWRYAYLAHRMIAMEAGHIGQSLYLAAEAAGLGACTLLGYDQAKMDSMIGVDGKDEFTIYMATVGKRIQE